MRPPTVLERHDVRVPHLIEAPLATLRSGDLRPAVFLLALTAFALLPFQGLRIGSNVTYSDVVLVMAVVAALVSPHRRYPAEEWPGRLLAVGLALMFVSGLIALAFSDTPATSAALLGRLGGVVVVSFALWRGWDPPLDEIRGVLTAFIAASVASAGAGILAAATSLSLVDRYESSVGRATGFAGNANLFGVVTVIGIGLAVVLASESRTRGGRSGYWLAAAVQFVGLLYSGSRGAVLGAVAVFVVVAVRLVRRGRWRVVALAGGAALFVIVLGLLSIVDVPAVDRFALRDRTEFSDSGESAVLRLEQIPKRLDQRGYHSLTVGSGLRDTGFHNTHLDFWAGLGVVGGIGWVMVCVATVVSAAKLLRRRDRLAERDVLTLAVGVAFLGFVVTGLSLDNTWNRYVWLLVALVPHLRRAPPTFVRSPAVSDRDKRTIVTALAVIGFAVVFVNAGFGTWATVADVALVGAAGLAVVWGPWTPDVPFAIASRPIRIGLALMTLGGLVGLVFSEHPATSAVLLGRVAVAVTLGFVLVAWWAPTTGEIRRLLAAFVFGVGISSTFGVIAAMTRFDVLEAGRNQVFRAVGFAGNANHLGLAAAMAFAVSLAFVAERPRSTLRGFWYVALVMCGAGVLWSGSRGALLGVGAVLVLVAFRLLATGRRRVLVVAASLTIGAAVLAGTVFRVPAVDRLLLRTDTEASAHAIESTEVRGDLVVERLERPGYWSLAVGSGMEERSLTAGHSTHLEIWLGTGFVGLVGWLIVCWVTFRPALRATWRDRDLRDQELLVWALGAAFLAYFVVGFVDEHIWDRFVWTLIALVAYLGIRRSGHEDGLADHPPPDEVAEGDGDFLEPVARRDRRVQPPRGDGVEHLAD